jgi:hypothetical protein
MGTKCYASVSHQYAHSFCALEFSFTLGSPNDYSQVLRNLSARGGRILHLLARWPGFAGAQGTNPS